MDERLKAFVTLGAALGGIGFAQRLEGRLSGEEYVKLREMAGVLKKYAAGYGERDAIDDLFALADEAIAVLEPGN